MTHPEQCIKEWFARRGWTPFAFQLEAWQAYLSGKNGLVHASTGTGKTYSLWLGILQGLMAQPEKRGLRVLWINPLRALVNDIEQALKQPVEELGLNIRIASRTGDSTAAEKKKIRDRLPDVLLSTPETVSLMLADPQAAEHFASLDVVVVDEMHELLASKRGVQTELCLARLRRYAPKLKTWGLSATIGNLQEAVEVLCPGDKNALIIKGEQPKKTIMETLLPEQMERYPWAGHLGIRVLQQVIAEVEKSASCILFTNTRSQTEIWFQSILDERPDWAGLMALHHGSLDKETRNFVEYGLKTGLLRLVVATSSLDLGVDFAPVDKVIQVGSPKGVARIMQRAGRSGHSPGAASHIVFVPTNAFELVEFAAVQAAMAQGYMESRIPLESTLDLLSQHLITIGIGGGFEPEEMYREVSSCYSYRKLSRKEWDWVLEFTISGGQALKAYPEYARLHLHQGRYYISSKKLARQHLLSIGTITSDAAMRVRLQNGKALGTIEEYFISRLQAGDHFVFAGRVLEFTGIKNNDAWARIAKSPSKNETAVPSWTGGRMPLSTELSQAVRKQLDEAKQGRYLGAEMNAVKPILTLQQQRSELPSVRQLLIEVFSSKEGQHLVFFPFEGRLVHEGLMALFAWRMSRITPISFSLACTDYGFELLSDKPAPLMEALEEGLLDSQHLEKDIVSSINASEMAKRQFRDIARVAGLTFQGYPGQRISNKNIQANSSLLYEVFARFDPGNLLLHQAQREVMERQLELSRIHQTLNRMAASELLIRELEEPSPLSFPIIVDRLREKLSSEQVAERIRKMQLAAG